MAYKNPKELMVDFAKYPAAIEGILPMAVPKISRTMVDAAQSMPDLPDFVVDIPAFPAAPALPAVGLSRPETVKEVGAVERATAAVPRQGRTRFLY